MDTSSTPSAKTQGSDDVAGIFAKAYLSQTSAKQPVRAATLISTSRGVGSLKEGL